MADVRTLHIPAEHLAAFLATVGIGTLEAIRAGAVKPGVATWTIAPPRFWKSLQGVSPAVDEVIAVLQQCDELSALQQAAPAELAPTLEALVARLRAVLSAAADPAWQARWNADG